MKKQILLASASVLAMLAMGASASAHEKNAGVKAEVNDPVTFNEASDYDTIRSNKVTGSYGGASGIMQVQQNQGSNNAVDAATAVQSNVSAGDYYAPAEAEVNTDTFGNRATQILGTRHNEISGSFGGAAGVATVQQNNGDNNDIGAATAVQANVSSDGTPFSRAEAAVNEHRDSVVFNAAFDKEGERTNAIDRSFDDFKGVAVIQQNNGSNNAIGAATVVQADIGYNGSIASDATVNGETVANFAGAVGTRRTNAITDSFGGGAGVATVQQNNGDNNQLGVATAVHVRTASEPHTARDNASGNVYQDVDVRGESKYQAAFDTASTRENTIDSAFGSFTGLAAVQQNNGSDNAISAANSVVGNVGGTSYRNGGEGDRIDQDVRVSGEVEDNWKVEDSLFNSRTNSITGSFNDSAGIASIQQNNGDVNVMGIGTAVAYNRDMKNSDGLNNNVDQDVRVWGEVEHAQSSEEKDFLPGLPDTNGRHNILSNAFNGAAGMASIQQNNGSQNVMGIGNAVMANIDAQAARNQSDESSESVSQYGSATGGASRDNGREATVEPPYFEGQPLSSRDNSIDSGAFNGFSGLATVQQNNGDNNVIGAANAVAMTQDSSDLLDTARSTASAGGTVERNHGTEQGGSRSNAVGPTAFDKFQGLATVQQNNGDNNVVAASNTVTANIGTASHGYQDTTLGSATNEARAWAYVHDNHAAEWSHIDRNNTISGAYNGAAGMMTSQQNNGDNNMMGASNSVVAELGGPAGAAFGPAATAASLSATVSGNSAITSGGIGGLPGRVNTISASFAGASGVMVSQQNNGDNNAIQSAVSVTANLGHFAGGNFLSGLH
jgi:hypothetical protein